MCWVTLGTWRMRCPTVELNGQAAGSSRAPPFPLDATAADTAQHHYIGSPRPPEHSKPSSLEDQYNELGNPLPDSPNASVELSAAAPLSPKAPVVMPSLQQAASQSEASSRGRKKFEAALATQKEDQKAEQTQEEERPTVRSLSPVFAPRPHGCPVRHNLRQGEGPSSGDSEDSEMRRWSGFPERRVIVGRARHTPTQSFSEEDMPPLEFSQNVRLQMGTSLLRTQVRGGYQPPLQNSENVRASASQEQAPPVDEDPPTDAFTRGQ